MKRILLVVFFGFFLFVPRVFVQSMDDVQDYLRLNARTNDPLYTTYAAAMERSKLYGDKAYKMDYYSGCKPVTYSSDQAGQI